MSGIEQLLAERGGLLAFGALLVIKIAEIVWNQLKTKEKLTDDSIHDLKCALEKTTLTLVQTQSEIQKLKVDLRRSFYVLKHLTGDQWSKLANEFKDLDI